LYNVIDIRKGLDQVPKTLLRNHIRRLRFEQDEMTQQELAKLAGCTRQTINAIEASKYAPSLELAFRISRVFGVGVEDVFVYAESED
jgi:putative transcriptional regulator